MGHEQPARTPLSNLMSEIAGGMLRDLVKERLGISVEYMAQLRVWIFDLTLKSFTDIIKASPGI